MSDEPVVVVQDVTPDQARRAHEQYNLYLTHREDAERSFLLMGADFLRFYENRSWAALGFNSFEEFCEAPIESGGCEVNSYRTAMRWAGIYKRYVRELRCQEDDLVKVGVYKLDLLRPHVNKENITEQIQRATMQSRGDLEAEVRAQPDPEKPPNAPPAYTLSARPVRFWPAVDAPPEFKGLYPDASDTAWIAHFPSEHNTVEISIIDIEMLTRDPDSKKVLRDGSEAWLYE